MSALHATPRPAAPAVQFKNILFATDFSDSSMKALPYASGLARKFGASLTVCHVVTPTPLAVGAPEAAPYLYQAEAESASRALEDLVKSSDLSGIATRSLMPAGILSDELKSCILDNAIDLVVAGTHGRTGVRRLLMGSSVEEICRISQVPVLTVGPDLVHETGAQVAIRHIVYPTDLSQESAGAAPYVAALAAAYNAGVTVLHVMPEETAANPDAQKLSEPLRAGMVSMFERPFSGIKTDFVLEVGDTVEGLLKCVRRTHADLIAMGIRNAFMPGFQLRASVAYRVIVAAPCPVLTCRP
jgi:nucleotide-binding universal stress UspA family protein